METVMIIGAGVAGLGAVRRILNHLSYIRNIPLPGRTGNFRYHNMDHPIAAGMASAEDSISSSRHGIHDL